MKLGYLGEKTSFHRIAADKLLSEKSDISELIGFKDFDSIFQAVRDGKTQLGLIAIENTLAGSLRENYDRLANYNLQIIGENYLHIEHHLYTLRGNSMENIRKVSSHQMAISQCQDYLKTKDWSIGQALSTECAAKKLIFNKDKEMAVIGSNQLDVISDLVCIKRNIETHHENFTRFYLISKSILSDKSSNKSSLVFQVKHIPGALFQVFQIFAKAKINVSKIESRPLIGERWKYIFYLDADASISELKNLCIIKQLSEITKKLRVLGSYKRMINNS